MAMAATLTTAAARALPSASLTPISSLHTRAPSALKPTSLTSSNSQLFVGKISLQAPPIQLTTTHSFKLSTVSKVSEGDTLPAFSLKDQDGRVVTSSKFKGKPLVVYFYPADETPGCTKQACAFRDSYEKFKRAGAEVVGISSDSPDSHKQFASKYRLPFTLLSDEGNKLRKDWGIPGDLFGTLPGRQTYVVDKKGVVRLVFNNQFQPEKHVDETLKILQSI